MNPLSQFLLDRMKRSVLASAGLLLFSFGFYLQLAANIGLSPWTALNQGLSNHLPITFGQAALGATIQVPTLDGKVDFELPEGTQTGKEFILREKGIPEVGNPRRRGSHRFTVVVETPTRLTKEQKDLLRQLDDSLDGKSSPKRKKFFDTLKDFFD